MLIVVTNPLCDLRQFVDSETHTVGKPPWPLATENDFVRYFGPIETRRKGPTGTWQGEQVFCNATGVLRWESRPANLGQGDHRGPPVGDTTASKGLPRLPPWVDVDGESSWRTREIFRRLYHSGRVSARFEIGFVSVPAARSGPPIPRRQIHKILRHLLQGSVLFRLPGGQRASSTVRALGDRIAVQYLNASSTVGAVRALAVQKGWVVSLPQLIICECRMEDLDGAFPLEERLLQTADGHLELYRSSLQPKAGRPVDLFVIAHSKAAPKANVRALRVHVQRVQAEKHCLVEVLRRIKTKEIRFTRGTPAAEHLQKYLAASHSFLTTAKSRWQIPSDFLSPKDFVRAAFSLSERETILEELGDIRGNLLRTYSTFLTDAPVPPGVSAKQRQTPEADGVVPPSPVRPLPVVSPTDTDPAPDGVDEARPKQLPRLPASALPWAFVFKGGGAKGIAFVGAVAELLPHFQPEVFAGTSAGAILAVMLGAGYSAEDVRGLMLGKDFSDFRDAPAASAVRNLILRQGLYPGDTLTTWIAGTLATRTASTGRVLMKHLRAGRVLVYASSPGVGVLCFDSSGSLADTDAAFAVRCSTSIPGFFIPASHEGKLVFDGGLLNNFPLRQFLWDLPEYDRADGQRFLGLYLGTAAVSAKTKKNLFPALLDILLSRDERTVVEKYADRTILIPTAPVGTLDFSLSSEEKRLLELRGSVAALEFLEKYFKEDDHASKLAEIRRRHIQQSKLLKDAEVAVFSARRRRRVRLLLAIAVGIPLLYLLATLIP